MQCKIQLIQLKTHDDTYYMVFSFGICVTETCEMWFDADSLGHTIRRVLMPGLGLAVESGRRDQRPPNNSNNAGNRLSVWGETNTRLIIRFSWVVFRVLTEARFLTEMSTGLTFPFHRVRNIRLRTADAWNGSFPVGINWLFISKTIRKYDTRNDGVRYRNSHMLFKFLLSFLICKTYQDIFTVDCGSFGVPENGCG